MKKLWMKRLLVLFALADLVFLTAAAIRLYLFLTPCRLEVNCQGWGVDTEWLKKWEEEEKEGGRGILAVAGWQSEIREEILAVSTGRKETGKLLGVYGNMELVFDTDLLSGSWGLTGREDICVISRDLADAMFGSFEVTGEKISLEKGNSKQQFEIVGVTDQKGRYLLIPMEEGALEGMALVFEKRFQAKERLGELFPLLLLL